MPDSGRKTGDCKPYYNPLSKFNQSIAQIIIKKLEVLLVKRAIIYASGSFAADIVDSALK